VSPAGLASVADDKILNTWRIGLQVNLLLIMHETSLNMTVTGIGKIMEEAVRYGLQEAKGNTRGSVLCNID